MKTFADLIRSGKWTLALPLKVRGVLLDEHTLHGGALRISAAPDTERMGLRSRPKQSRGQGFCCSCWALGFDGAPFQNADKAALRLGLASEEGRLDFGLRRARMVGNTTFVE